MEVVRRRDKGMKIAGGWGQKYPYWGIFDRLTEKGLFLFRKSQETVTRAFFDDAVSRKFFNWSTFGAFGLFGKEINCLLFTTTQCNSGLLQVVSDAFAIGVTVSHEFLLRGYYKYIL